MKLLSAPRQPFVGLALVATAGILLAEFLPVSISALMTLGAVLAACVVISLVRPILIITYAIVGLSFFLIHIVRTTDTVGERLAAQLGDRPRMVTVTGSVANEPKVSSSGFSTFLF